MKRARCSVYALIAALIGCGGEELEAPDGGAADGTVDVTVDSTLPVDSTVSQDGPYHDGYTGATDAPADKGLDAGGAIDAFDSAPVDASDAGAQDASDASVVCDPVVNNGSLNYYVDPSAGSDATSGSGFSGGVQTDVCAFKTLTHALSVIGTPTSPTTINIANSPLSVATGEVFPLVVHANTTIVGLGGPGQSVQVPPTMTLDGSTVPGYGFQLLDPSSTIQSLTIDGQNNGSLNAIVAGSGTISGVTAKNFIGSDASALIVGGSGNLQIQNGSVGMMSWTGLHVTDNAVASITGDQVLNAVVFLDNNTGILVDGRGSVSMTGVAPTSRNDGTVTVSGNTQGIVIDQAATSSEPPLCTLNGVLVYENYVDGVQIGGGSNVTIENSFFGMNYYGVRILTAGDGNDDTSHLDLGSSSGTPGNVLQPIGFDENKGAGLCFDIDPDAGQTLLANNNSWQAAGDGGVNCSQPDAGPITISAQCFNAVDLGGQGLGGNNVVSTQNCSN